MAGLGTLTQQGKILFDPVAYHVQRRWGASDDNPSVETMREDLAELDADDAEHPDTWLTHESGWTLAAFQGGLLIWENVEEGEPKLMQNISRDQVLELWHSLLPATSQ